MTGPTDDSRPQISVVLPSYREPADVLKRAMESVLGQTFANIELIVVVDDPTNAELRRAIDAAAASDKRIRVVVNSHNLGAWSSYNRGIREASGEFVAIQDSDDVSMPNRLEVLHAFLRDHPQIDVVGSAIAYVDAQTERTVFVRRYPSTIDRVIRRYSPVAHPSTLRKRALHESYGYYDESPSIAGAADYDLWCRWYAAGVTIANIPAVLYQYRQHSESFKAKNIRRILLDTIEVKRRHQQALRFGYLDRLVLLAESVVSKMPSGIVLRLFYLAYRTRSRIV